jgi:hypothetical protein
MVCIVFGVNLLLHVLPKVGCEFKPQTDACNPCARGCGFFASATLESYCRVCFKTFRAEEVYMQRINKNEQREEDEMKNPDEEDAALSLTLGPDSDAAEEAPTITVAHSGSTYTGPVHNKKEKGTIACGSTAKCTDMPRTYGPMGTCTRAHGSTAR